MSIKPILFNTEMVQTILDGHKSVTRRIAKNCIEPYQPGDILYVRETWCLKDDGKKFFYFADKHTKREEKKLIDYDEIKWKPSIHMPKEAARIWLRVTDIHAERLQDITAEEIRREGLKSMAVHCGDMAIAQAEFKVLWDSTVKAADVDKYGWDANPYVWVVSFELCKKPEEE